MLLRASGMGHALPTRRQPTTIIPAKRSHDVYALIVTRSCLNSLSISIIALDKVIGSQVEMQVA